MSRGPLSVCRATELPVQQANLKSQQPRCLFELSRPECRLLKGPSPLATPAPAAAPRPEGLGGDGKGEKEGGLTHVMGAAPAASGPTVCRWPSPPTALLAVLLTSGPPHPPPPAGPLRQGPRNSLSSLCAALIFPWHPGPWGRQVIDRG